MQVPKAEKVRIPDARQPVTMARPGGTKRDQIPHLIPQGLSALFCAVLLLSCSRSDPVRDHRLVSEEVSVPHDPAPISTIAAPQPAVPDDVLSNAPAVRAARQRYQAAQARARLAGVLPDPMVMVGYMRVPATKMESRMIEVEQPLPRWGERTEEQDSARAAITMAATQYAAVRGRTAVAVHAALIERRSATALAKLDLEIAARARVLADLLTRSAVAVGKARVREPLSLESRATEAELMAAQDDRMAADAAGMAAAILGLPPGAVLPELATPDPDKIDVAQAPEVVMAQSRAEMATADESMARSRGRPMVSVIGRWREDGEEKNDAWEVALRVSVPLWREAYAGAVVAAGTDRSAATLDRAGALVEASEMLARARRAIGQAARARQWAEATSTRLAQELDTLAAESAAGMAGATAMLFDRFDELAQAQRTVIVTDADAARARAGLWLLAPPPSTTAESHP